MSETTLKTTEASDPAGFWLRAAALLIDGMIVFVFRTILFILAFKAGHLFPYYVGWIGHAMTGSGILFSWLYFAGLESSINQATLGKRILGIAVTDDGGNRLSFWRATIRLLMKYLSLLTFGVGFFMSLFTKRKQTLHDKIVGSLVVIKTKPSYLIQSVPIQAALVVSALVVVYLYGPHIYVHYILRPLFQSSIPTTAYKQSPKKNYQQIDRRLTRVSEAEYDRFLSVPAQTLEPSHWEKAGPALLKLSGFTFGTGGSWIDIDVRLPDFPNNLKAGRVAIAHVWDKQHRERYKRDEFEDKYYWPLHFQRQFYPSAPLETSYRVYLIATTKESDIDSIEGELVLSLPINAEKISFHPNEAGQKKGENGKEIRLVSMQGSFARLEYEYDKTFEQLIEVQGFDAKGQLLNMYLDPTHELSYLMAKKGDPVPYRYRFGGEVKRVEIYFPNIIERRYPFVLRPQAK